MNSIASAVVSLKAVDVPVTRWAPWFGLSSNPNWGSTSTAEQVRLPVQLQNAFDLRNVIVAHAGTMMSLPFDDGDEEFCSSYVEPPKKTKLHSICCNLLLELFKPALQSYPFQRWP